MFLFVSDSSKGCLLRPWEHETLGSLEFGNMADESDCPPGFLPGGGCTELFAIKPLLSEQKGALCQRGGARLSGGRCWLLSLSAAAPGLLSLRGLHAVISGGAIGISGRVSTCPSATVFRGFWECCTGKRDEKGTVYTVFAVVVFEHCQKLRM